MRRRLLDWLGITLTSVAAVTVGLSVNLFTAKPSWYAVGLFALASLSALGSILLTRAAARPHDDRELTLEDKVDRLRSALKASSSLVGEINAEFELQVAAAEKIKAEAEQNQRLAELNAAQAQAVKNLVESVQGNASRLGSRQQWMFFLAGLLAAIPLGVVGNFAFELVKAWLAS